MGMSMSPQRLSQGIGYGNVGGRQHRDPDKYNSDEAIDITTEGIAVTYNF